METTRSRTAWPAVAAAVVGFLAEAVVAAVPGSPLQPVLAPGADPGGPFVWVAETTRARSAGRRPPRGVRARRRGGHGGVPPAPPGGMARRSDDPVRPRAVDRFPSRDRPAAPADLPGRLLIHRARADRVAAPREPVRPDARRLPGLPVADARRAAVGRHPVRLRAPVHPSVGAGHPDDLAPGRARRRVPAHHRSAPAWPRRS